MRNILKGFRNLLGINPQNKKNKPNSYHQFRTTGK